MSRLVSKFFWAIIGLGVFYFLSIVGIDVSGSTFGGIVFILVILFIIKVVNESTK